MERSLIMDFLRSTREEFNKSVKILDLYLDMIDVMMHLDFEKAMIWSVNVIGNKSRISDIS